MVAICVAGKNAITQAKKVHQFLSGIEGVSPFDKVRELIAKGGLLKRLKEVRMGQYKRIKKAFEDSLDLGLRNCSLTDLTNILGVGNKTSRFFLLHSRRSCEYVVLDTHILRFLREQCGMADIPKSTPTNPVKYSEIEERAKKILIAKFPSFSLDEIDLKMWLEMSARTK